jgi:hypothetical protein
MRNGRKIVMLFWKPKMFDVSSTHPLKKQTNKQSIDKVLPTIWEHIAFMV